jgi:hypothetical protein
MFASVAASAIGCSWLQASLYPLYVNAQGTPGN